MSSWLSTATQKAKEAVGAAQKTVDSDVDALTGRLRAIEGDVALLRKTLETSSAAMLAQAARARSQMVVVVMRLSETLTVGTEDQFASFRDAHAVLDNAGAEKLQDVFAKVVLAPLDEWLATFSDLKAGQAELEGLRVAFDHYRGKVKDLEDAKRAQQLKGKVFAKADEEKIERNKEKLRESETAYNDARDKTAGTMLLALEEAGQRMDLVLLRTMQYERQVFEDGQKTLRAWEPHVATLLGLGAPPPLPPALFAAARPTRAFRLSLPHPPPSSPFSPSNPHACSKGQEERRRGLVGEADELHHHGTRAPRGEEAAAH